MIYARHSFGKRKEKKKRNRGLVLRVGPHFGPTQRPGGEKMVVGWRDGPGWPVGGGLLAADGVPGPPLGAGLGPAARKQVHGRLRVHGGVSGPLAGSWWTWSTLSLSPLLRSTAHRVQPGGSLPLFSPCSPLPRRRWAARRSGDRLPRAAPPSFHSRQRTGFLLRCVTSRGALLYLTLQTAVKRGALRRGGAGHGGRAAVPWLWLSRAFF